MRRCYYCGAKKNDDMILCERCAKELDERLKEKKDDKRVRECDTAHKDKS